MPADTIRVRIRRELELTTVRVLIRHPMELGPLDPQSRRPRRPHYITEVSCTREGHSLLRADWGFALSENPFFSFRSTALRPGDQLRIAWQDNRGGHDERLLTIE